MALVKETGDGLPDANVYADAAYAAAFHAERGTPRPRCWMRPMSGAA